MDTDEFFIFFIFNFLDFKLQLCIVHDGLAMHQVSNYCCIVIPLLSWAKYRDIIVLWHRPVGTYS